MKLHIVIPGPPVGKNDGGSRINFKRKTYFTPRPMKLWMRKVAVCAWGAAVEAGWPSNPFAIKEASYLIERFNVNGDFDRGNTFLIDALQFTRWWTPKGSDKLPGPIGVVGNDKHLWCAGSPPTIIDNGVARVEVTLELRAIHAPHEADALLQRWYKNEARRALRKKDRLNSKEFIGKKAVADTAAVRRSRDELAQVERNLG
ncbi:MAG: hypothetical protein JWO85_3668, partial [Candidatus Eremiobacteraeota bacterium]|nr:hypothetical protein [Candidatus Eremiobacteraeota bacterium]